MIHIAIFTSYTDNGTKLDHVIMKKNKGFILQTYFDGQLFDENKIYKVNTDKPYVRSFGTYFYITGEELQALKEMTK